MVISGLKKNLTRFCLYTLLFLSTMLISQTSYRITKQNSYRRRAEYPTNLKYILFWNKPKNTKLFDKDYGSEFLEGQTLFVDQNCSKTNCFLTHDRSLLDIVDYDAIVIDVNDINKFKNIGYDFIRHPYQKFIFWAHESASKLPVCSRRYDQFFTWTWTYKLDSDIPQPFINIHDINKTLVGPNIAMNWTMIMNRTYENRNKINGKNKAIAWIVPKCTERKKHEHFILELKGLLKGHNNTLDLYGPCGDYKCPGDDLSKCYEIIEKQYLFQLVLEESFAEDYVTEDMVKTLDTLTVPIVLGGADYDRFLPPKSYVNAKTYDMKKLASSVVYLKQNMQLNRNKKLVIYEYFFDWKNHYYYSVNRKPNVCKLCELLNEKTEKPKVYSQFRKWWNPEYETACQRMEVSNIFKNSQ